MRAIFLLHTRVLCKKLARQDGFLLCLAWPYKLDCKTVRDLSTENHEASAPTNFSFACQASHPSRLLLLQTFLQDIIENYFTSYFFTCIKISCFSSFCVNVLRHKGNCDKCHIFLKEREVQFPPQLLNRMGFKAQARMVKCCKSTGRLLPLLTAFHIAEKFFSQRKFRPI